MKKCLLLLLFGSFLSIAQKSPNFNSLRYHDDFRSMVGDSSGNWYPKLKFASVSKNDSTYFSFGGDIRLQYFKFDNEDWGDTQSDKDGFLLNRYLLHVDFHTGKHFRAFFQIQSSSVSGRLDPSPIEENPLDWHQAFADWKQDFGKGSLTLRVGRQEFWYGSQRLVAVREFPNNRLSLDAAKLIFMRGSVNSEVFFAYPVVNGRQIFDDNIETETRLWGNYTVLKSVPFLQNIDVYYFGLRKENAAFANTIGREHRHSFGTRIWNKGQAFLYDIEGVYQFGALENQAISAWTISSYLTYRFENAGLKPKIGLKTEVISGDRNASDNRLQTFNPLFPRGAYFGLAGIIGPSNLYDIHPEIALSLTKTIDFGLDYDLFWRFSTEDGIYAPNVSLIYPGESSERFIGTQLAANIAWEPNAFFSLKAETTWFDAGNFLKNSGAGQDIFFFGITSQFKF
ncbi:alginate export family protein [Flavobacterium sp.]|uniref:alginate export family protein n=1 Tax=Flavobacterium sp. TaxID=239 RepID=UPI001222C1A7|nr:alginate export family protein [Flavobacterium sp.]RZJ69393.1 MAG: hypothetical protein EOO49_17655 [Flavobacterium sp.]